MNSCDCPIPPGGRATCDDDQLAICVVTNGVADTFCVSPPSGGNAVNIGRQVNACLAQSPPEQRRAVLASVDAYVRSDVRTPVSYRNFVLSIIKRETRTPDQAFDFEDRHILSTGEHEIGDSVIRFRMPLDDESVGRTRVLMGDRGVPV